MDNTDPLPDSHPKEHEPEVVRTPPLEVHSPNIPPIEYMNTRESRVIALATFFSTLWGKVVLGAVAAVVLGTASWHFVHHHKPLAHPVEHAKTTRATPKHAPAPHKHAARKSHAHKTSKKHAKKMPAQPQNNSPKRQPRPWFSSKETNG
jgi:hypothetical protein